VAEGFWVSVGRGFLRKVKKDEFMNSMEPVRVLKEKEVKQFGEYRTRRLVLEAWDGQGQG